MAKRSLVPLKFAELPAVDRKLWEKARQPAGPFDEGGVAATWSAATCRHVEQGYGILSAWFKQTGNLDAEVLPIDRLTKDRLRAFLDAYTPDRAPLTVATIVKGIAYYHRATSPPDGLAWLTKLAHRMMNAATPSRAKLPRMAHIAELIELGQRLMTIGLEDLAAGKVSGAQIYRDGLMMAALAARPALRLRNLHALRIDHSFLQDKAGVRVRFSGKETKKGNRLDFFYPGWLSEPFAVYLADVRPVLLKPHVKDEGWLWIGRRGRCLPANNITTNITNATKRYLNRGVPPHLFRDCASTDIAVLDPAHVGITKDVLGHKTLASSQRFYNQAASITALGRLEHVLSKFMDK
jgi:integrase/recombinase XerC